TQAVMDLLGGGGTAFVPKGTIDGTEDLDHSDYMVSGFWMPEHPFTTPTHASYPLGTGSNKGCLIAFQEGGYVVQQYVIFSPSSSDISKLFIRIYDDNGSF